MKYTGTYVGTIHTYCSEFNYTDRITFTIDENGYIDLPYSSQGELHDGRIDSSGRISGISISVYSQSLGKLKIPYSATDDGKSFKATGTSSNGITSTINAKFIAPAHVSVNDSIVVREDSGVAARGNVFKNDSGGTASVAVVKGKAVAASGSTTIIGTYGKLTIAADGTYSYTLDDTNPSVNALYDGGTLTEAFRYIAKNDSGSSSATLSVTVRGHTDVGKPVKGTSGNDLLYSSSGADAFNGGLGVDTASYALAKSGVVANLASPGHNTGEAAADTYLNIDNLRGSIYADSLTGNSGRNVLDGGRGADKLYGLDGDDIYLMDSIHDKVIEGANAGIDTIKSSVSIKTLAANVEKLFLTGTANLSGTGNSLDNTIIGNSGANKLNGGLGSDVLTGGAGQDTFLFTNSPGARNLDHITDFKVGEDTIALDNAVFKALTHTGTLAEHAFAAITDATQTVSSDTHILYDKSHGALYYDADGGSETGRIKIAVIDNHASLTFQDIQIV